jgi:hypothetical protein
MVGRVECEELVLDTEANETGLVESCRDISFLASTVYNATNAPNNPITPAAATGISVGTAKPLLADVEPLPPAVDVEWGVTDYPLSVTPEERIPKTYTCCPCRGA